MPTEGPERRKLAQVGRSWPGLLTTDTKLALVVSLLSVTAVPSLFSRVLYGNKISEIPKELFSGLVSLQLL